MPTRTPATATRTRVTTKPPVDVDPDEVVQIAPNVFEVPDEDEGSRIEERPPSIPTPSIGERVRSVADRAKSLPDRTRKSFAGKPGLKKPRVSVESLISTAWGFGARLMQSTAWPVANVLRLQSPIAGAILEDTVKNTVADTILQPLARFGKSSEIGFALLGPPILVGIACARPDSRPWTEPLLREALKSWLTVAGPKMIELAEKERQFEEEYGETIDGMITAIFTPPEGMVFPTNDTP